MSSVISQKGRGSDPEGMSYGINHEDEALDV